MPPVLQHRRSQLDLDEMSLTVCVVLPRLSAPFTLPSTRQSFRFGQAHEFLVAQGLWFSPYVDGAAFDCCSCPTRSSPYVRAQVLLCLSLPCPSPTQHSRRASRAVRSFVAFMSLDFSHTQSVSMRVKWAPAVVSPATATPVATCLCGQRQAAVCFCLGVSEQQGRLRVQAYTPR